MAIIIPVSSTWDKKGLEAALKDINSAKGKISGVGDSTKKLGSDVSGFTKSLKSLGKTIVSVYAAKEIGQFFTSSVKGAMDDQKAQVQLEKSIRNTSNATSQQIAGLESFIASTQFATGVLDDNLRPALNSLVLATGDVTKSQNLLTLALDISSGTGKDLESVTTALAKAAGGQYTALQRLGVGLNKAVFETKDLDTITGVLSAKFSGQAAAAAATFGGQMQILNAYAQDAKETIGYGLIQAIEMFSGSGGAGRALGELLQNIAGYLSNVIIGIAATIKQVQSFTKNLEENYPGLYRWVQALGNVAMLIFNLANIPLKFFADAGQAASDLAQTNKTAGDRYQLMAEKLYGFKTATESTIPTIEKAKKATKGLDDATKALINSQIKAQDAIVNNLEASLKSAESTLEDVKGKFNDLRDTISGSITDIVDFGAAVETGDFLSGLVEQSTKATTFADKVKKLIQIGLSESSIRRVVNAGYEAGSIIADNIIAGGQTVVDQVNTLVKSVEDLALMTGELGANTFYQAGVQQGEALVAGIKNSLEAARAELERLRASLAAPVTTTTGGTKESTIKNTGKIETVLPKDESGRYGLARFSRLASGGIVTKPTNALIGEAGPEAVIPLTGSNTPGMGQNFYITVNAGIGTNGAQVGKEIVDAIKRYERTSGPVFVSA